MNILVTGANGQLGNCLRNASRHSNDNYFFTDVADLDAGGIHISRLDITDAEAVKKMVRENDVNVIVNCAAYTNVDKAETDADFAELLNAAAVRNLADAIKENDGTLIHVSTDYVFGKEPYNVPCREDQKGTPTGVYGLTKLHGEQQIEKSGVKALIFRTAWLYSEYGRNFVKTMLNLTSTKPELKVVFDQAGTPTYAQDLADAIFDIVENRRMDGNEGTYHYSRGVLLVRLHKNDCRICRKHRVRHTAVPFRRVPLPREAPLLLGARQNQVQGHFQCPCTLLDRLIEKMY